MQRAGVDFDLFIDRSNSDSIKWAKFRGRDVIPLWIADMDFQSPASVITALHKRAEHGIFGYGKPPKSTMEIFIDRMARLYNWSIDPEWIVWLPGLVTGINLACRSVGHSGAGVLTTVPVYPPFLSAPGFSDRSLTTVPMQIDNGQWKIDNERLEKAIAPDSRLFLLCNPHNPTGRIFSAAELESLADICLKKDLIICSDEIHCELILDPDKRHIPFACLGPEIADRTITLMAPSKTFNIPGLACSMAIIANKELRSSFQSAMAGIVPDVNIMGFVAAGAAMADTSTWLDDVLNYLRQNRDLVFDAINRTAGLSMQPVQATYLAWIRVEHPAVKNPVAFFHKAGVGLSDGADFGTPGFVRLNFACQRRLLQKALERISNALKAIKV